MTKKQELIDYVIGNEFITKPSLQKKFTELLNEALSEQLRIGGVSKSLRDKEQFIELAKMIEIHIQKSVDYQASIGTGYFTERFNEVYKKYLESNVC